MAIATATLDYYFSEVSTNPDKREKVGMLGTGSLLGDPMGRREIRNWKRRTGPFTSNFEFQISLDRFLRDYSTYLKRNIKSQTANPARQEWIRLFLQFININNMLHIIPMIVQSSFDRMEVFLKNRKDLMFIFS